MRRAKRKEMKERIAGRGKGEERRGVEAGAEEREKENRKRGKGLQGE